ncbi:MAG TPA: hypothetical protein VG937_13765 [Polyangiaceae bacterium]|nr:hypothetical protein [Polyangiaceae bacterium]
MATPSVEAGTTQSAEVAQEPSPSNDPGAWRRLALFVAMALFGLAVVVLASRSAPPPSRRPFDEKTVKRLRATRPDWVLIGNSLVNTRFHERTLNQLLAPKRVSVLGVSGSKSAVWYLTLKNQVLPVTRPRRVLIFFYGYELTSPRQRALGAEHFQVDRVSLDDEPVVEKKLAPPLDGPIALLGWELGRLAPVERLHRYVAEPLDEFATRVSELLAPDPDRARRKRELNEVFALGNLRSVPAAPQQLSLEATGDFSRDVESSLLPDIIEVAKNASVPLTFIRIRTRELAEGGTLDAGEQRYLKELERYLHAHGAKYVDMANETWESIDLYGEGHHISRRYTQRYTRLFVQHMARVFE